MIVVILLMVSMVFVLRNFNLGLKDKGTFNIIASNNNNYWSFLLQWTRHSNSALIDS